MLSPKIAMVLLQCRVRREKFLFAPHILPSLKADLSNDQHHPSYPVRSISFSALMNQEAMYTDDGSARCASRGRRSPMFESRG